MSDPCQRGCRAFKDWTMEHYHADDRPAVVVFHTPEQPGPTVTLHEGWGTDAMGETTTFPTASEAASFAKRRYGATVTIGPDVDTARESRE